MTLRMSVAALLLGTLTACDALRTTQVSRRTLEIHHHAVECMGPWHQLCLLVRPSGAQEFGRHYGGIEGFVFEWGYVYEIEVEERPIPNPPQDGSSIRTVLRRSISRERVPPGTGFEMFVTAGDGRVVQVAPDRYRFYDVAEFVCADGAACAELNEQLAAGARIRYEFRHGEPDALPLSLVSWETCDRTLVGSASCRQ